MKKLNQVLKTIVCFWLIMALVMGIGLPKNEVKAYSIPSESSFVSKLNSLKSKYPNGGTYSGTYYEGGAARAWTCYGYAWQLAYDIFGSTQYTSNGGWTKSSTMGTLYAGDFVRINNDSHSIFITKISGDKIYYTDANYDYKNGIRWDVYLTKSQMSSKFTYKWHLTGNTLTGTGTHTHNYNTYVSHWGDHPHYKVYKCSCGELDSKMNETTEVATCAQCMNYANIEEKDYYLRNKSTGWYLNVSLGKDEDCTQVHAYQFENYISQMISIKKTTDGYEMMPRSSSSGKVINVYADTVVSGKNVNLYHKTNDSSQWWKFQPKNGGYVVRNVQNPNVCLTVDSSGNIIVSTYSGGNNQIWYLEERCEISYSANGGTGAPEMWYARDGYEKNLSTVTPTRAGYTFLGWSTNSKATKAIYQPGDACKINGDIKLYAVWKNNSSSNTQVTIDKTKIKKATKKASSTTAKIKLKKVKGVTGYQVKVSTTKKFTKSKTIKKNSTKNTIKVKKLKAYKKYYVKARCYKVVNGTKLYSKWTSTKKVKIK